MKKKLLLLMMILVLVTACGKVPKLANGEEAVVSFDNEKLAISANDLYNELKDKFALGILIDLIDRKILEYEYPNEKTTATDYAKNEIEQVKAYFVDEDKKYDEQSLLNALKSNYGISTIEEFEAMLILSHYRTLAIEAYAKKQITDKQINEYYKNEIVGDIECSHILIKPDVKNDMSDKEKKDAEAAALKVAQNVIKELNAGGKFADLAKQYSADKSNNESGGKLGYFNKGDMAIEFETAAYALKLNEYSKKPVKTSYGYHIILKTGEKEKETLEKVKDEIIATLAAALQASDRTLSIDAMIALRKSYGFEIQDSNLKSQYSKFISQQILSAQNQGNQ